MAPKLRVAFWILGPLGALLIVGAVFLVVRTGTLIATGVRTRGKVVDLASSNSSDGASVFRPVVTFEVRGEQHTFTSSHGSKPAGYDVGDQVGVIYLPDDPAYARIDSFGSLWLGATIAGSLGLFFGGIAWLIWIGRS